MKKKILIVGSGSRENALAWKLSQSPRVGKIFIAPGNPGTARFSENLNINATDINALIEFAQKNAADLTVVGPEDPLALGIVDAFLKQGLKIWGPSKAAAQIESSKTFAKELMKKNNIPTAEFETFSNYNEAIKYVETKGAPIVIKASGLALGKGVTICKTLDEAKGALKAAMVDKVFGDSGSEVVIEEFLEGMEFSAHAFCDGKTFKMLPFSQDHKKIFDGDQGPNTGGIGTIAPLPWTTDELINQVSEKIVQPTLEGLKNLSSPFTGLLYPGLMATGSPSFLKRGTGGVKVIEFNCRFGGPECESYMRILKTDLLDILEACVQGTLDKMKIEWHPLFACCIILCSKGYPDKYDKGFPITGIEAAEKMEDVVVFHAGTAYSSSPPLFQKGGQGGVITNDLSAKALATAGGRVLGVTATGNDLKSALNKAYAAVKLIHFEGMHYRGDIGQKSLFLLNTKGAKY